MLLLPFFWIRPLEGKHFIKHLSAVRKQHVQGRKGRIPALACCGWDFQSAPGNGCQVNKNEWRFDIWNCQTTKSPTQNKTQIFNREGRDMLEQFNWSRVGSASLDVLDLGLEGFS